MLSIYCNIYNITFAIPIDEISTFRSVQGCGAQRSLHRDI